MLLKKVIKINILICFIWSVLLTGCAATQQTDLYFGLNIPGGGQVSELQWKGFSDTVIGPFFPEGYTEFDVRGKWRDTATLKTIAERTKMVTFVGKKTKKRDYFINTITQTYIHRFRQQAVLRVDSRVKVNFIFLNN